MKMAVLGTGVVGSTIASGLVQAGHQVRMGARARGNARTVAWAERAGAAASHGNLAEAAAFTEEIVFNCTAGVASLVDLANPLDFSRGMPFTLTIANDDSLGERIHDLGDITTPRGTEKLLALWVRLYGALGDPWFDFRIVRGSAPS